MRFAAAQTLGDVAVSFDDQPVVREVVDPLAQVQAAQFRNGSLHVVQAGHLTGSWTSNRLYLALGGQTGIAYILQASSDLVNWTPLPMNRSADLRFGAFLLPHRLPSRRIGDRRSCA